MFISLFSQSFKKLWNAVINLSCSCQLKLPSIVDDFLADIPATWVSSDKLLIMLPAVWLQGWCCMSGLYSVTVPTSVYQIRECVCVCTSWPKEKPVHPHFGNQQWPSGVKNVFFPAGCKHNIKSSGNTNKKDFLIMLWQRTFAHRKAAWTNFWTCFPSKLNIWW